MYGVPPCHLGGKYIHARTSMKGEIFEEIWVYMICLDTVYNILRKRFNTRRYMIGTEEAHKHCGELNQS
jgi:hypothetical protein